LAILALSMTRRLLLPERAIWCLFNGLACEVFIQCKTYLLIVKLVQRFHSVTQSSFDNPCTPLPGGFDSGITGNPQQTLILPEWNLTITDENQRTISSRLFYIAQGADCFLCSHLLFLHGHCSSSALHKRHGWVRSIKCLQTQRLTTSYSSAINVPLTGVNHSFTNFSQNAKALTNPPTVKTC
jgi:hypothetical protein